MLDLRRDRVDYTGGLLAPPDGFRFERAVATTYSLDLETLLAVLLPLAFGTAPESLEACSDGLLLLRALRHTARRLTVFHQAGQIPPPHRATPLHALLDRILVPVALPPLHGQRPPAFHPKTWTIEFRNGAGESRYRFLVLSRNLSRGDSLDIALSLESGTDRRQTRRTGPLLEFLAFLRRSFSARQSCVPLGLPHARDHIHRLEALETGLATHPLVLGEDAAPWEDFDLFPLFDGASRRAFSADPLFSGHPGRVVVMSPFLDTSVIRDITKSADGRPTLLTRPDAYAALDAPVRDSVDAWALKDVLASSEPAPGIDADTPRETDLHAKLYLRETPAGTALLLGSMNATASGHERNVEMMVRLRAAPHSFGCRNFLRELFGKKDNPFELLSPDTAPSPAEESAESDRKAAQAAVDLFCRCRAKGHVEPDGTAHHAIVVEIPTSFTLPDDVRRCTLRPLIPHGVRPCPARGTLRFGGLALAGLSPLFVLAAETASITLERVVHVPLDGLNENERDQAAVQAVVDANGGWTECLGMFFAPAPCLAAESRNFRDGNAPAGATGRSSLSGLYEDMLRTAATPDGAERFAELDIDSLLARQTSPEAVRARELLALFRQVLPKKRRHP